MEKKFYTLVTVFCLTCLLSVRAQDTTACNAGFSVFTYQHTATFRAWDTLQTIQHSWSFGDGTSLSFNSNNGFTAHYYTAPGHYTVVHAIRDSLGGGCFDSSVQVLLIDTAQVCFVDFYANIDSVSQPNKYTFVAYPGGPPDTVRWYINDSLVGSGDTLWNYSLPQGQYKVCVYLHTIPGCFASTCKLFNVGPRDSSDTVHIPPPPPPDTCTVNFNYSASPGHPNEVQFYAEDSAGLDSLTWVIWRSNDTLSTVILHGEHPVHVFADTGCYRVDLYATSPSGCSSYTSQWVCIDSLSGDEQINCYPNPSPGQSTLDLRLDENVTVHISVFNSMGHLVLSKTVSGNKGVNQIVLPTAGLPKGIYYVQVQYGKVTKRSKIQKL